MKLYNDRNKIELANIKPDNFQHKVKIEELKEKSGPESELEYILCIAQKNWPKQSINIWLVLFKYGNDLYEQWKQ